MVLLNLYTAAAYLLSTLPIVVPSCIHQSNRIGALRCDQDHTPLDSYQQDQPTEPLAGLSRTTLTNVKVFDGEKFGPPGTVVISGTRIESVIHGACLGHGQGDEVEGQVVDGNGGYLLPGFIDAHTHPTVEQDLVDLTESGITTTFVQSCFNKTHCNFLKSFEGLTDVFHSGVPATAPGSTVYKIPGFPHEEALISIFQVPEFVFNQVVIKGADHIKLILGPFPEEARDPTISPAIARDVNFFAHRYRKRTVAHTSDLGSVNVSLDIGVDQIHHVPLDFVIDSDKARQVFRRNIVSCPTLIMMQTVSNLPVIGDHLDYEVGKISTTGLHRAGVPILAGTDAFSNPAPFSLGFGSTLHDELYLLTAAGLSELEVIKAATVNPATHNGLTDRGVIAAGKRGDLVLLSEDPLKDINATRKIERVWLRGKEYPFKGGDKSSERSGGRTQWPLDL